MHPPTLGGDAHDLFQRRHAADHLQQPVFTQAVGLLKELRFEGHFVLIFMDGAAHGAVHHQKFMNTGAALIAALTAVFAPHRAVNRFWRRVHKAKQRFFIGVQRTGGPAVRTQPTHQTLGNDTEQR